MGFSSWGLLVKWEVLGLSHSPSACCIPPCGFDNTLAAGCIGERRLWRYMPCSGLISHEPRWAMGGLPLPSQRVIKTYISKAGWVHSFHKMIPTTK